MAKQHPVIQHQIGTRIKNLRARTGYTQESLALKAGLDRTYINSVENGRRNISVQALEKIITALDTSFKAFFAAKTFNSQGNH